MQDKKTFMALKALQLNDAVPPNNIGGRLSQPYQDADILRVMRKIAPKTHRMFFRDHGPSPRAPWQNRELGEAFKRLWDAGLIDCDFEKKRGRPSLVWFLTEAGKELLATQAAEE